LGEVLRMKEAQGSANGYALVPVLKAVRVPIFWW